MKHLIPCLISSVAITAFLLIAKFCLWTSDFIEYALMICALQTPLTIAIVGILAYQANKEDKK